MAPPFGFRPPFGTVGVGHDAITTSCDSGMPVSCGLGGKLPRVPSCAVGETHVFRDPIEPLPDVRRPDARCAQIGSRRGISHAFQVSEHSGEPFTPSAACNLLAKDD
jgi:hypothetical protein